MSLTLGGIGGLIEVGGALLEAEVDVEGFSCACTALTVAKRMAMHRTAISVLRHFLSRFSGPIDEQSMWMYLVQFMPEKLVFVSSKEAGLFDHYFSS